MKRLYNKYVNYIVITFFVLLGFKSCQSCSRQETIEWQAAKHEAQIDSLNNTLDGCISDIGVLQDSIEMYRFKMGLIEKDNKRLTESNQQIQSNNTALINTNNRIINKVEKDNEKFK